MCYPMDGRWMIHVALLTEGVDRNRDGSRPIMINSEVALLTEGVDRNQTV